MFWDELENRHAVAIGLREFAYVVSRDKHWSTQVRQFLVASMSATAAGASRRVLGRRRHAVGRARPRCDVPVYNHTIRIAKRGKTDPAVVVTSCCADGWRRSISPRPTGEISCWQPSRERRLPADCSPGSGAGTSRGSRSTGGHAVDVGVLQFFPAVERVERGGQRIQVDLVCGSIADDGVPRSSWPRQARALRDLLQTLFVAELMSPSRSSGSPSRGSRC